MLFPVFRVVTTQYPIAAATTIEAGHVIALDSDGYVVKCPSGGVPLGIAADRNRASEAYEWVNRVSDSGNDTRASGMMSVYSMGEFFVDVDDSAITTPGGTEIDGVIDTGLTIAPGTALYTSSTAGHINTSSGGQTLVAYALMTPAALDAGIPGEYEPNSVEMVDDTTPRTWCKIKLVV